MSPFEKHGQNYGILFGEEEQIMRNSLIDTEILTERLNDMYATVSDFLVRYPDNTQRNDLLQIQKKLAIAHHRSRIHIDEQSVKEFHTLLAQGDKILSKARIANVLPQY